MEKFISEKSIVIVCNAERLWDVLTNSEYTTKYMFNCTVASTWLKGAPIIWEGDFEGYKAYQKGEILKIEPKSLIKYSTFDPNFGLEDKPENYIHVSYIIEEADNVSKLTIINETFDGNKERMGHINQGWDMVIDKIKDVAENVLN